MKTSLVIKTWGGQFRRGSIPSDGTDFKMVPWFCAKHVAHGRRSDGRTEWTEPDQVHIASNVLHFNRGKVNEIRFADAEFIDKLDRIDVRREELKRQLARLHDEEQELLDDAYIRGNPMTLANAKEWLRQREAAKQATPATPARAGVV